MDKNTWMLSLSKTQYFSSVMAVMNKKNPIDKLHPNTAKSEMLMKTVNFKIRRLKGTSLPVLK